RCPRYPRASAGGASVSTYNRAAVAPDTPALQPGELQFQPTIAPPPPRIPPRFSRGSLSFNLQSRRRRPRYPRFQPGELQFQPTIPPPSPQIPPRFSRGSLSFSLRKEPNLAIQKTQTQRPRQRRSPARGQPDPRGQGSPWPGGRPAGQPA